MKTTRSCMTLLAALGAAFAAGAHAAEPAVYLGVHGGWNNLSHWDATVGLGAGVSLPGGLSLDSGTQLGVVLGRQTENARFELEFQAGKFDITAIQLGAARQGVSDSGSYKALTFNAYRTHPFGANVTGYAGVGIGWGSASLPQLGFTGGCNCFVDASGTGLAYLARIGVEYKLQERHHTFVQYTGLRLPKFDSGGSPGTSYGRKTVGIAAIGYRYLF